MSWNLDSHLENPVDSLYKGMENSRIYDTLPYLLLYFGTNSVAMENSYTYKHKYSEGQQIRTEKSIYPRLGLDTQI